jgi:hypothetical protein
MKKTLPILLSSLALTACMDAETPTPSNPDAYTPDVSETFDASGLWIALEELDFNAAQPVTLDSGANSVTTTSIDTRIWGQYSFGNSDQLLPGIPETLYGFANSTLIASDAGPGEDINVSGGIGSYNLDFDIDFYNDANPENLTQYARSFIRIGGENVAVGCLVTTNTATDAVIEAEVLTSALEVVQYSRQTVTTDSTIENGIVDTVSFKVTFNGVETPAELPESAIVSNTATDFEIIIDDAVATEVVSVKSGNCPEVPVTP